MSFKELKNKKIKFSKKISFQFSDPSAGEYYQYEEDPDTVFLYDEVNRYFIF